MRYASFNNNSIILKRDEEGIFIDIQPNVKKYLEMLLSEAEIQPLDEKVKDKMIQDLYSRLDDYTSMMLMEKLSPQKRDEFFKKSENSTSHEELEEFLRQEIPNIEDAFEEIFLEFKNLYLGN